MEKSKTFFFRKIKFTNKIILVEKGKSPNETENPSEIETVISDDKEVAETFN